MCLAVPDSILLQSPALKGGGMLTKKYRERNPRQVDENNKHAVISVVYTNI
jgi:hypothetical protein